MNRQTQHRSWILGLHGRAAGAALALAITLAPAVLATGSAQAQTFSLLYSFTITIGNGDGYNPDTVLVLDAQGNLYGATGEGGIQCEWLDGCGTVFKVNTTTGKETVLYSFTGGADGWGGSAGLVLDAQGNLYSTTYFGGDLACKPPNGCGTVFMLDTTGKKTVLYSFTGTGGDGASPIAGLVLDAQGNLYGTTASGGAYGCGTVFKLDTTGRETVLYSFTGGADGASPWAVLLLDAQGNLYGTTAAGGGNGSGTVFKLDTTGRETVLYSFTGWADGAFPQAGLVWDAQGNLYGTTYYGGDSACNAPAGCGTVFKLSPTGEETVLYSFTWTGGDGAFPHQVALVRDAQGNLYGTTSWGGDIACWPPSGCGTVFKVDTTGKETILHTFTSYELGGDGTTPTAGLVRDVQGNLYGTVSAGGEYFGGDVFELSPHLVPTTTALMTAPNPSTLEQLVTITATVSPAGPPAPTGTVNFTSNGSAISGCTAVPLTSSLTAVCTTSTLAVGTDAIVATYSGDTNYSGSSGSLSQLVNPTPSPLQFVAVTPCRLVDTRPEYGGSGPIQGGTFQSFPIQQAGSCNIPTDAAAYSLNVTVVPHGPLGYLTIWPTGEGQPVVSTMNSVDGRVKADAAIVPAGSSGEVSVYVTNTTDVILDIDGYFAPVSSSTLAFYPLPPCRVVDTRVDTFPTGLGPPQLFAATPRDFPVLNSPCIPSGINPAAYSFNFTVVPGGHPVGYLSAWPTGQSQPVVSTLNDQTGTIVANAAIVPAGGGDISVYSTNDTQLLIDINGYFAPGPAGLSLYAVAPCRVIDTRHVGSGQPFSGTLTPPVDVVDSPCGPPATALAYVFNATVVPTGALGYLTLWPDGTGQPVVSTLNAFDGSLTNNMAIVPTNNGKVDAYANGLSQLILDISSYFAP